MVYLRFRSTKIVAGLFVLALCVWVFASSARACSTPVYRYAMYRWAPRSHFVFFFHKGPVSEKDKAVHQAIEKLARGEPETTNIELIAVDMSKYDDPEKMPPMLRDVWEREKDRVLPAYEVVSPHGETVHRGALDTAAVESMVESAAKTKLIKLLDSKHTSAMVLLSCKDEKANKKAEKAVREFAKLVEDGKIRFDDFPAEMEEEGSEERPKSRHSFGLLKLDRSDPKERWLVRSLLAVESDLTELDEPMVFFVFGRCRALPPYVGKGITTENLADCGFFVTGNCTCTIRDQNPGVDMLTHFDWEAAAERMAERYGPEEGNNARVQDLFPQILVPGGDLDEKDDTDDKDEQQPGDSDRDEESAKE